MQTSVLDLIAYTIFAFYVFAASPSASAFARPGPTTAPNDGEPRIAPSPSGEISGPEHGTLVLCSTRSSEIFAEFLKQAGGSEAKIIVVVKQMPPNADPGRTAKEWGVRRATFWLLKDRKAAQDKALVAALNSATGVWFPGGKPLEYVGPLLNSDAHRALKDLLGRDGVIGGESAGAIVQSSCIVLPPGSPHAGPPLEGLGFAKNVVIFPHYGIPGKFAPEFCQRVVSQQAGIIGIALPDGAAVVIHHRNVKFVGKGTVIFLTHATAGSVSTSTHASGGDALLPEPSATESR